MASPAGDPSSAEPTVEIRRVLGAAGQNYQSTEPTAVNADAPPPINSVNAANGDAPRTDKAPLLQGELLRSLSGVGASAWGGRADGLSTFSGVFCPVAVSMFSILLFLRMGFVVGQSGILVTLCQLFLAYGIVMLTVLSLCAVSTNGAIEGGGVYYMISRALGPEFGGSIGVLFFLANVFANALYISGFVECICSNFGPGGYTASDVLADTRWWRFLYGVAVSALILLLCLVGAAAFAKVAVVIFGVVVVSYTSFLLSMAVNHSRIDVDLPRDNILAYEASGENDTIVELNSSTAAYTGIRGSTFNENLFPNYTIDYTTQSATNFALVFAVVFSFVTGNKGVPRRGGGSCS